MESGIPVINTKIFTIGRAKSAIISAKESHYDKKELFKITRATMGMRITKFKERSGFQIYQELKFLLEHIPGRTRSSQQIEFHNAFLTALTKKIFKKEWATQSASIKSTLGLPALMPMEVWVCTPRRYGKTTALLDFMAAAIATVPNIVTSLYSTTRDQTSAGRDVIYDTLQKISNFGGRFEKANTKKLSIRFSRDDIRHLTANPCSVKVFIFFFFELIHEREYNPMLVFISYGSF